MEDDNRPPDPRAERARAVAAANAARIAEAALSRVALDDNPADFATLELKSAAS